MHPSGGPRSIMRRTNMIPDKVSIPTGTFGHDGQVNLQPRVSELSMDRQPQPKAYGTSFLLDADFEDLWVAVDPVQYPVALA